MNTSTPHARLSIPTALCAIASALALLSTPVSAASMSKDQYQAAKSRIEATQKAEKQACEQLSGNANDICEEEAEAKEDIAEAELEAQYTGKPADIAKVAQVKAKAAYDVAEERCDEKGGNAKDVCLQEAKSTYDKARADDKLARTTGKAQAEAMDTKRQASLKLEVEKCDSLAGDAKSTCVATAKNRFGTN